MNPSRTSPEFARAWVVAGGGERESDIPNHKSTTDASDAGSHHVATDADALDRNWSTRNNGLAEKDAGIRYSVYSTRGMNADMN